MKANWLSILALALMPVMADIAIAATSSACPGEDGFYFVNARRRNPSNGGFVSHNAYVEDSDDIFIAPTAAICGSSKVTERAKIYGTAKVIDSSISGRAEVFGSAVIKDGAEIIENGKVSENAVVSGSVRISGDAIIGGDARVVNYSKDYFAQVTGRARVTGTAKVTGNAEVSGNARVMDNAVISGDAIVSGTAVVRAYTKLAAGQINSGTKSDPDYEGIAKAKRDAEIAENARLAKLARDNKAKQDRNSKITRYNAIVEEIESERWLGSRGGEYSYNFPSRCEFRLKFHKVYKSSLVPEDTHYELIVKMSENVGFEAEKSSLWGVTLSVNLRGTNYQSASRANFVDNLRGRKDYEQGILAITAINYRGNLELAQGAAKLLNEAIEICQSL